MIFAQNITFRYRLISSDYPPILKNLSLEIEDSESVAIIGPNGSGKSTLGRCLNGLLVPQSGKILIDGLDTSDDKKKWNIHKQVGMIFQNPENQLVTTTVEREIAFGLENLGLPSPEICDRVEWVLDRFHLSKYRHYPPHKLSGGEKQRVAIASVTAMQPRYLICDEPTSLLDPYDRRVILDLLFSIIDEYKMSMVFITQSSEEATQMDRVVLLAGGKLVKSGTPEKVYYDSSILVKHGLEIPVAKQLGDLLRTRGFKVPDTAIRPKPLVNWLSEQLSSPLQYKNRQTSSGIKANEPPHIAKTDENYIGKSSQPPIIEFDKVNHTYSLGTTLEIPALRDITTQIYRGNCVAITGANGSGKSTMIQHLNGLLEADSGRLNVDGINVATPDTNLKELRKKVGLVFQFPEYQMFEETIFDEVAFGPRQLGIKESEIPRLVNLSLERVNLDPKQFLQRHPLSLSGGEKRRAAIAGILVTEPSILALDEPTSGLDSQSSHQVEAIFKEYVKMGATLLLITHDMDLISRLADRILVLKDGRLKADGTTEKIFAMGESSKIPGLGQPSLCELLDTIKKAGFRLDSNCFQLERAAEMIDSCIKAEKNNKSNHK